MYVTRGYLPGILLTTASGVTLHSKKSHPNQLVFNYLNTHKTKGTFEGAMGAIQAYHSLSDQLETHRGNPC